MTDQSNLIVIKPAGDHGPSLGQMIQTARVTPPDVPDMPTPAQLSEPPLTAEPVGTLIVKMRDYRRAQRAAAAHQAANAGRKNGPYRGRDTSLNT